MSSYHHGWQFESHSLVYSKEYDNKCRKSANRRGYKIKSLVYRHMQKNRNKGNYAEIKTIGVVCICIMRSLCK